LLRRNHSHFCIRKETISQLWSRFYSAGFLSFIYPHAKYDVVCLLTFLDPVRILYYFARPETFEQLEVSKELFGKSAAYLKGPTEFSFTEYITFYLL
jgi:hypothetical protein